MSLGILEEPRTFPPKTFFLAVWFVTLGFGVFGMVVAETWSIPFLVWTAVTIVAFRQIWTTRWVQVDREGIRVRNLAQRGREMNWSDITDLNEREIPVRKGKFFVVMKLTGEMKHQPGRRTTIVVDSDTDGFEVLREVIRGMVGTESEIVSRDTDLTDLTDRNGSERI